jgi:GTPase SAR1 family protein
MCRRSKAIVALMPTLAWRRVICGDGAVGKMCLLNRHNHERRFLDGYKPTIFKKTGRAKPSSATMACRRAT